MKEIDSSYLLEGSPDEILAHLSPTRIAEYMGYTVHDTKEGDSGQRLRVQKYDTKFTLAVRETIEGFRFSQFGSEGPFRVLEGDLRIKDAGTFEGTQTSRVTVDITYTIGSFFSFLLDWLARRIVKRDADIFLENLAKGMAAERAGSTKDAADVAEVEQDDIGGDEQDPDAQQGASDQSSSAMDGNRSQ